MHTLIKNTLLLKNANHHLRLQHITVVKQKSLITDHSNKYVIINEKNEIL